MGFIRFLGTAGSRYTTMSQKRASGGIWLQHEETKLLIDPGPGSLVRIREWTDYDPHMLDGIVLTHKHLDHSNDVNIMTEVMTGGGKARRGTLIAPHDAFGEEGVVIPYCRRLPETVHEVRGGEEFTVGSIRLRFSVPLAHGSSTHGITFYCGDTSIALIADTDYFVGLEDLFRADILIVSCLMVDPKPDVYHLSLPEAAQVITAAKPRTAFLTHFGLRIIDMDTVQLSRDLTAQTGVPVLLAEDGQLFGF
jgi:phosphoribosyl 1,2-cyclic phosphodiesterase